MIGILYFALSFTALMVGLFFGVAALRLFLKTAIEINQLPDRFFD